VAYFEKIRDICKELCSYGEYSNARTLYSRSIQSFFSIPKSQRELMPEEDRDKITSCGTILHTNVAFCFLRKKMYDDCIKHAEQAL